MEFQHFIWLRLHVPVMHLVILLKYMYSLFFHQAIEYTSSQVSVTLKKKWK